MSLCAKFSRVSRYLVCGDLCNCLNRISAAVADGTDCVVVLEAGMVQQRLSLTMAVVIDFAGGRGDHSALIHSLKMTKIIVGN
jgi:hypothetical protein